MLVWSSFDCTIQSMKGKRAIEKEVDRFREWALDISHDDAKKIVTDLLWKGLDIENKRVNGGTSLI